MPVPYIDLQKVVLRLLALMFISRGTQLIIEPEKIIPDWALPHEVIPNKWNAAFWLLSGFICLAVSFTSRVEVGFFVATLMPIERAFSYWWSFAMYLLPGGTHGKASSIAWAGWWTGITLLIFYIGSWAGMQLRKQLRKDSENGNR